MHGLQKMQMKTQLTLLPLLPKGRVDNVLYRAQIALRAAAISKEELRNCLEALESKKREIVFPSHFFEFEYKELCLSWLEELSIPFSVQISPGAELFDYQDKILQIKQKHHLLFRGIELVMDRAPHEGDWQILQNLEKNAVEKRFVFCPVIEISAIDAVSNLPANIHTDLYLYFPKKQTQKDSFYSSDEIYIFLAKIKERLPVYTAQVLEHLSFAETITELEESDLQKKFRNDLNSDVYIDNFPILGKSRLFRATIIRLAKNFITAPILILPYLVIWLFHDPRTLLLMPKKFLVYPALAYKKFTHIGWHLFFAIDYFLIFCRYYLISLLLKLRRILEISWMVLRMAANALIHPATFSKHHCPPLYWLLFFPVLKIYWFLTFQFKKRVLKIQYEEPT